MITGKLISLNIRGISNFRKRKTTFTWCRKQKAEIIFLQGKTAFYRHYFDNGVIFTKDLLYDIANTQSFRAMKEQGLTNSNFLVCTGLRQSVPFKLSVNMHKFKTVIDLENYECKNYYYHLIKFKYEKTRKWDKLGQEFDLREDQLSEAYLFPLRVASEPYVRSFHYEVFNYILYTNDRLFKIGYVSNPCKLHLLSRGSRNYSLYSI